MANTTTYLGTVCDLASGEPLRPATAQELLHSALAGVSGGYVDADGRIVYVERGDREEDIIDAMAHICAAAAITQCAEPRALRPSEDAGRGDYDALERALGRPLAGAEKAAFRAAYSAALAEAADRVTIEVESCDWATDEDGRRDAVDVRIRLGGVNALRGARRGRGTLVSLTLVRPADRRHPRAWTIDSDHTTADLPDDVWERIEDAAEAAAIDLAKGGAL